MKVIEFIKGLFKPKYRHSEAGREEAIIKINGKTCLVKSEYTDSKGVYHEQEVIEL